MADMQTLKLRVEQLAERDWDVSGIQSRLHRLQKDGIPAKILERDKCLAEKASILDRVQLRAEEYNFGLKNCAQGTALALLEEFGLGSMPIIKALTPFPGIAGTGETCGGITGSLIAFGLYFGSDDPLDAEAIGATIGHAQKFMTHFEAELGYRLCADIHANVVFGRNMDPGASEEKMIAFAEAKGFEKCGLAAGIGARLAAGYIIDQMERRLP